MQMYKMTAFDKKSNFMYVNDIVIRHSILANYFQFTI
jgi:hypothetical protein